MTFVMLGFGLLIGGLVFWISPRRTTQDEVRSQAQRDAYRAALKASWDHARRLEDAAVRIKCIGPQEWACWFALEAPEGSDR